MKALFFLHERGVNAITFKKVRDTKFKKTLATTFSEKIYFSYLSQLVAILSLGKIYIFQSSAASEELSQAGKQRNSIHLDKFLALNPSK